MPTIGQRAYNQCGYQGLITSADSIYHLKRIGPGHYRTYADPWQPEGYEVEIEDALMKPLVSGAEAKRYTKPKTETYLLFPYQQAGKRVALVNAQTFAREYPKAWAYLCAFERDLRRREAEIDRKTGDFVRNSAGEPLKAPFNDEQWYRFGRHQNLDKQEIPKLIVPRLVANLHCTVDEHGDTYLDNVDVGGVQAAEGVDPFWLAGLLNSPVLRFVFKRISKPFRGAYLSANRQFIAPLPIPAASDENKTEIAAMARGLQSAYSRRRDVLDLIARRMATLRRRAKPETWLFPGLKGRGEWERDAPEGLDVSERRSWAKGRYDDAVASSEAGVGERLKPGVSLDASFREGELKFFIDDTPVIDQIFLGEETGAFVLAQWKVLAASFAVTEKTSGKKLCVELRKVADSDESAAVKQVIAYQAELEALDTSIKAQETALNDSVFSVYRLSDDERALVEKG